MSLRKVFTAVNRSSFGSLGKFHCRLIHFTLLRKPLYPRNSISDNLHNLQSLFFISQKYKHKKAKGDDDEDDDYVQIDVDESELSKASKVINTSVSSMRVDIILKSGLGISRNKIETAFYDSKIRKNGRKVLKKSEGVAVGDELDLITDNNSGNPNFMTVSRLKIIGAKLDTDVYRIRLIRDKNLLVEKEDQFK